MYSAVLIILIMPISTLISYPNSSYIKPLSYADAIQLELKLPLYYSANLMWNCLMQKHFSYI